MNGQQYIHAQNLYSITIANKGSTIDPQLNFPRAKEGYIIGGISDVTAIPKEEFTLEKFVQTFNVYADKIGTQQNLYVGTWFNDDVYYMELSQVITDKADAISFAKTTDQKAIWDISNNTNISI